MWTRYKSRICKQEMGIRDEPVAGNGVIYGPIILDAKHCTSKMSSHRRYSSSVEVRHIVILDQYIDEEFGKVERR